MNSITFSKRLYGIQGNIVFLAFNLSVVLSVITRRIAWQPYGLLGMTLLIILFAITGTLGWRAGLRKKAVRWLRGYFAAQLVIFVSFFALENIASGGGATSGNLVILLLLQSCVLPWRTRLIILGISLLCMLMISLAFLPALPVFITTLTLIVEYGGVLLVGNLIVSEERARQQLAEAHEKLTDYTARAEELATMRERNRLAREIHDSLGHYLTIINVQIEVAKTSMQLDPEKALVAMNYAQQSTREGLAAVRGSVAALREPRTEHDMLNNALAQLVEEHRATGFAVDYCVDGQIPFMSDDISLTLYRVAQEALTNIRKHAHAKHTDISLSYIKDRHISLCIKDDGIGRGETKDGFGLVGIQERVGLLGGKVDIETSPGQGFRLCVEVKA